jgi:hypothetical protein
VIVVCLAVNIRGLEIVTVVLGILLVMVMSPFLAYFFYKSCASLVSVLHYDTSNYFNYCY